MIQFTLPKPISVNEAYGNNRGAGRGRYLMPAAKAWKREAELEIMMQGRGKVLPEPPLQMTITVPYNPQADACNYEKLLTDTLKDMKVIPNDTMKYLPRVIIQAGAPSDKCLVQLETCGMPIPFGGKVS